MILIGSVHTNDVDLEDRAFEMPKPERTKIVYDGLKALPEYIPYLVQISAKDDIAQTITFNVLNPDDLTPILANALTLDLTDLDSVWRRLPSTILGWDAAKANCALLFLTERYTTAKSFPKEAKPKTFGPCTKWPCSAADLQATSRELKRLRGDSMQLLNENTKLVDENAKLQRVNAALDAAYAQVSDEHAKVATSYFALKQQLKALQLVLTPEQLESLDGGLFT